MNKRPQKAPSESVTNEELRSVKFPLFGSAKLDGYRCVTTFGAFTSSLKPVTNRYIQEVLSDPIYNGLDGELIVGAPNDPNVFNNTTGPVRKFTGEPDFKFFVFDRHDMPGSPYSERLDALKKVSPFVHVVKQSVLRNIVDVGLFELRCVEYGFEGAMIRSPNGIYKPGRCTLKEANIFKRKPVVDGECTIIGFEEQQQNNNTSKKNELGNMVRSSHASNKSGKGTLGAFIVHSPKWKEPVFRIGTGKGLTVALRQYIWDNQEKFLNQIITYKYQLYGSINAPRQPIYKGVRDINDLTYY